MDVGLFMDFQNPARWPQHPTEVYRNNIDDIVLAEQLGFGTVWLSEHHFDDDGWTPSLLPLAAAIATRTQRIRIGTFVLPLPFHNPLRVAEDATTVDILSAGRLDVGLGQGYRVKEFAGFGVPRRSRASLLEHGVEVIRRAWTEEQFSYSGPFWEFRDVRLAPRPVQRPHPPIWIGARGEKAIDRAARLGCHLIGAGQAHTGDLYDAALRRYGQDPDAFHLAQLLPAVYVAETREDAWNVAGDHVHHLLSAALPLLREAGDLPEDRAVRDPPPLEALRGLDPVTLPFGSPIIGSPDDCIRVIRHYQATSRLTHLALGMHLPGLPAKVTRASLELFARHVMPHVSPAGGDSEFGPAV